MAADPVVSLLDRFHAAKPVRAWSLIVTLYGDAIVPRGGSLWLGSLIDIMEFFRIDAGHVRTAMSRLTADGWLERERIGRNSYYRLSRQGEGSFAAATQRIYFAREPAFDAQLRLALLGAGLDDRAAARPLLERAGFSALSPNTYLSVTEPPKNLAALDGFYLVRVPADDTARAMAAAAWKLAEIAEHYRAFIAKFSPLEQALASKPDPGALIARTLLIHEFRRIVLREPILPAALLPADWPGACARALTARIYRALVVSSERYLDAHARSETGALPPPDENFAERFAT
jgi:phenylacetic acid degradation operon negative regulatory protein